MRNRKIMIFLTLGFLVGICVLLYPSFSSFWNSKTQSRAIVNYESVLNNLTKEDYEAAVESMAEAALRDGCTATNPRIPMKHEIMDIYRKIW